MHQVFHEGFSIRSRLDEAMLKQLAEATGGAYFNATSEQDLVKIYQDIERQLVVRPEKTELTSIFAGASVLIILAGGILSLLWFSRMP